MLKVQPVIPLAMGLAQPEAGLLVRCYSRNKVGGADRDRTDDILLAKQALSQLSYSPNELQCSKQRLPV